MIFLGRNQWGASLPLGPSMKLPAVGVHLHHSVTLVDDDGVAEWTGDVAQDMWEIERIGEQRFGRFPYSYCGHPSGVVAEGAGVTVGAHTENFNSTTFGYCLIGNYSESYPTDSQVTAFQEWWHGMIYLGLLKPDAYLYPHRHRKSTQCPGNLTMEVWDRFYQATLAPPVAPLPPSGPDKLLPGQLLAPDQYLVSPNGEYMVYYQQDGNLVVYDKQLRALWASMVTGGMAHAAIMQTDGNLVTYNGFGHATWNAGTMGRNNAYCVIQDDGNFVIYQGATALWWSKR